MASKEQYWQTSTDKQMLISVVGTNVAIDNSMLEYGTFSLEESLCSESELKFGCCEANSVKFTARDTAGSINGKTISITETIDGDTENPTKYGTFKVYSDIPTADRTKRQITAYDAMYDIINADVKSWYAGLSFPMTLKAFRDSFFAHLGIEQVATTLVNDSMTVNKTLVATQTDDSSVVTEESSISGKTVVTAICEINGCFGNISRDGKFEYVILPNIISAVYPSDDLFPSDDLYPADANTESMSGHYITFDYEDFQSKAITQLEIRASNNTAGAIVGTSGNNYVISGNFLVSDKTGSELEQIANNVLPIMKQAVYTPLKSCTCVGNPCLELGDPIRFNTTREIVETYILQRTLTGVQSKRDSIVTQGTETHIAKVNSMRETLESVQRRTSKLERNADHLLSQFEDLDEQTSSKIEQTAEYIASEVTRAQGAESALGSKIEQTAEYIASEVTRAQGAESALGSKIEQTAESITEEVKGKVGDNEVRSKFAMDPSNIDIESGRINFKSNTLGIDSENFALDPDTGETKFFGEQNFYEDKSGSVSGRFGYGYIDGMGSPLGFYFNKDIYVNKNKLLTGIEVSASGQSGKTGYTTRYFLSVAKNGTYSSFNAYQIYLSDRRCKRDVSDAPNISDAYMNLKPVHFRFKEDVDGVDDHWHYGFIAQDVKQAFRNAGIDSENEALVGLDSENDVWLLDKDELHAMHVQMIQRQEKEIELLKKKNKEFEDRLSVLERSVNHAENL